MHHGSRQEIFKEGASGSYYLCQTIANYIVSEFILAARRPSRNLTRPNYRESSSSESDADEIFNRVASNISSPDTPLSPSNPNFLYQTSPPLTRQVLADALANLQVEEAIQAVKPNWPPLGGEEEVVEGHIVEPAGDTELKAVVKAASGEPVVMTDFDVENGQEGDKAQEHARSIKVDFNPTNISFWFAELEGEMTMASVKSQWLKRTLLQRNLPVKQQGKKVFKSYCLPMLTVLTCN